MSQYIALVWSFSLLVSSQLFGEPDADEDVSPDTEATDEQDSGGHKSGGQKSGDLGEHDSGGQGEGVPMSDGLSDGVNGMHNFISI